MSQYDPSNYGNLGDDTETYGLGVAGQLAGGLINSGLGFLGQQQTNANNAAIASNNNIANANLAQSQDAFQASQVSAQEAFQANQVQQQEAYQTQSIASQEAYATQMSDTAYQRGVAGLKAAGLNPIMAAASPASTPQGTTSSGAAASGSAASGALARMQGPNYQSPLSSLKIPDIMSLLQTASQIKQTNADTDLSAAQTAKVSGVDTQYTKDLDTKAKTETQISAFEAGLANHANKLLDSLTTAAPKTSGSSFRPSDQDLMDMQMENQIQNGGQVIPLGPGL